MSEPSRESIERLLWFVHDEFMGFAEASNEHTVSVQMNFDRLFIGLADLAKAIAGGYREGGLRQ